jgi:hypothetical protein
MGQGADAAATGCQSLIQVKPTTVTRPRRALPPWAMVQRQTLMAGMVDCAACTTVLGGFEVTSR